MHFIFFPYGKKSCVDLLISEMSAEKHKLKFWKGEQSKELWIQGQVRQLPFGFYEYIFPKEDMDFVLTTLEADKCHYSLSWIKKAGLRMITQCEPIPPFKTDKKLLWVKQDVNIIPIGIRHDGTYTDPDGENEGWTHEAI